MEINKSFWKNKTVFLTGHTGFKGGWLTLMLSNLGARVHGYSLDQNLQPNLFEVLNLQEFLSSSTIADIRDLERLNQELNNIQPEIIFHMAAQPLVLQSYQSPIDTISTNVQGTVNVLEAARLCGSVKAIVNVTTDKCYANDDRNTPFKESDKLGGNDIYSASKACSELISLAYNKSFLEQRGVYIATARAGNVIGGGDWSPNRLLPDVFRALDSKSLLEIRNPSAIRPWQHVLEPLYGYIKLSQALIEQGKMFSSAWNFGPDINGCKSVEWIINKISQSIPETRWKVVANEKSYEANVLKINSEKAKSRLNWVPKWDLETAISKTLKWHQFYNSDENMAEFTLRQINKYLDD